MANPRLNVDEVFNELTNIYGPQSSPNHKKRLSLRIALAPELSDKIKTLLFGLDDCILKPHYENLKDTFLRNILYIFNTKKPYRFVALAMLAILIRHQICKSVTSKLPFLKVIFCFLLSTVKDESQIDEFIKYYIFFRNALETKNILGSFVQETDSFNVALNKTCSEYQYSDMLSTLMVEISDWQSIVQGMERIYAIEPTIAVKSQDNLANEKRFSDTVALDFFKVLRDVSSADVLQAKLDVAHLAIEKAYQELREIEITKEITKEIPYLQNFFDTFGKEFIQGLQAIARPLDDEDKMREIAQLSKAYIQFCDAFLAETFFTDETELNQALFRNCFGTLLDLDNPSLRISRIEEPTSYLTAVWIVNTRESGEALSLIFQTIFDEERGGISDRTNEEDAEIVKHYIKLIRDVYDNIGQSDEEKKADDDDLDLSQCWPEVYESAGDTDLVECWSELYDQPLSPLAYIKLCNTYIKEHEFDKALACFTPLTVLNTSSNDQKAYGFFMKGKLLHFAGVYNSPKKPNCSSWVYFYKALQKGSAHYNEAFVYKEMLIQYAACSEADNVLAGLPDLTGEVEARRRIFNAHSNPSRHQSANDMFGTFLRNELYNDEGNSRTVAQVLSKKLRQEALTFDEYMHLAIHFRSYLGDYDEYAAFFEEKAKQEPLPDPARLKEMFNYFMRFLRRDLAVWLHSQLDVNEQLVIVKDTLQNDNAENDIALRLLKENILSIDTSTNKITANHTLTGHMYAEACVLLLSALEHSENNERIISYVLNDPPTVFSEETEIQWQLALLGILFQLGYDDNDEHYWDIRRLATSYPIVSAWFDRVPMRNDASDTESDDEETGDYFLDLDIEEEYFSPTPIHQGDYRMTDEGLNPSLDPDMDLEEIANRDGFRRSLKKIGSKLSFTDVGDSHKQRASSEIKTDDVYTTPKKSKWLSRLVPSIEHQETSTPFKGDPKAIAMDDSPRLVFLRIFIAFLKRHSEVSLSNHHITFLIDEMGELVKENPMRAAVIAELCKPLEHIAAIDAHQQKLLSLLEQYDVFKVAKVMVTQLENDNRDVDFTHVPGYQGLLYLVDTEDDIRYALSRIIQRLGTSGANHYFESLQGFCYFMRTILDRQKRKSTLNFQPREVAGDVAMISEIVFEGVYQNSVSDDGSSDRPFDLDKLANMLSLLSDNPSQMLSLFFSQSLQNDLPDDFKTNSKTLSILRHFYPENFDPFGKNEKEAKNTYAKQRKVYDQHMLIFFVQYEKRMPSVEKEDSDTHVHMSHVLGYHLTPTERSFDGYGLDAFNYDLYRHSKKTKRKNYPDRLLDLVQTKHVLAMQAVEGFVSGLQSRFMLVHLNGSLPMISAVELHLLSQLMALCNDEKGDIYDRMEALFHHAVAYRLSAILHKPIADHFEEDDVAAFYVIFSRPEYLSLAELNGVLQQCRQYANSRHRIEVENYAEQLKIGLPTFDELYERVLFVKNSKVLDEKVSRYFSAVISLVERFRDYSNADAVDSDPWYGMKAFKRYKKQLNTLKVLQAELQDLLSHFDRAEHAKAFATFDACAPAISEMLNAMPDKQGNRSGTVDLVMRLSLRTLVENVVHNRIESPELCDLLSSLLAEHVFVVVPDNAYVSNQLYDAHDPNANRIQVKLSWVNALRHPSVERRHSQKDTHLHVLSSHSRDEEHEEKESKRQYEPHGFENERPYSQLSDDLNGERLSTNPHAMHSKTNGWHHSSVEREQSSLNGNSPTYMMFSDPYNMDQSHEKQDPLGEYKKTEQGEYVYANGFSHT